ncbi:MAG: HD domain-containing protein [Chlamydiales bacterium]|nr:HD domain-containing protein [Chlamydiales bacterium]
MSAFSHKVCDPIHGFIRLNSIEKRLIETAAFQRLRYLRQMGMAYLVYPGATHTRFEHSLGVMELASRIFHTIYPGKNAQAVRLAALCHDLGHLPFSHTAEESLLGSKGHEQMTIEIVKSLKMPLKEEVLALLNCEGVEARIITDDNFGADRIDYLLRDAYYTGVRFGHVDYSHLIDSLCLIEGEIGVHINGIQAVESLWIARYMMYARVYHHTKVCIYSEQMRRFMEHYYQEVGFPETIEEYLAQKDYTILHAMEKSHDPLLRGELANQTVRIEEKSGGEREFLVLTESGVVSSSEASPFLRAIPAGARSKPLEYPS